MKDWQKGFLSGLFIGSFGVVPLLLWLSDLQIRFRCPHCDSPITVQKRNGHITPQLSVNSPEEYQNSEETNSSEASGLSIATAPTV